MNDVSSADTEAADRRFRRWMAANVERAARRFSLTVTAEPVFGWRLRSIGASATGAGGPVWLRVVSEQPQWARGHAWTGNADANHLRGLPKPRLLAVDEWTEGDWRVQRAEVLTLLPGVPCSPVAHAHPGIAPDTDWWESLRDALGRLGAASTGRVSIDQAKVSRRLGEAFGADVDVHIKRWETVHADLHWGNLLTGPLGILDWEMWGTGPAGTDAATLHSYSLAVPDLADAVRRHFPVLGTPDGDRAQLYVIARLLHRAGLGDHPHLVEPLRSRAREILDRLRTG